MLLLTGFEGRSLAAEIAFGGDKTTFEVVMTAIRGRLQPEEVTCGQPSTMQDYGYRISPLKLYDVISGSTV